MDTYDANIPLGKPRLGGKIAPDQLALFEANAPRYLTHLDGLDVTEEQKVELLKTLWSILSAFVEMGYSGDLCAHLFNGVAAGKHENADQGGPS